MIAFLRLSIFAIFLLSQSGIAQSAALDDYFWLHRHPETSGNEQQTAAFIAKQLSAAGCDTVLTGIGNSHSVVALIRGTMPQAPSSKIDHAAVLYRFDMDALPLSEQTGASYSSSVAGVMHACGHDIHMATGLAVVRHLIQSKNSWSGTVVVIAQASEETGTGSNAVLADHRVKQLLAQSGNLRMAVAIHNTPEFVAGDAALHAGYVFANVDSVDVAFYGKGGHGAQPHETIDPIVMAAEFVMAAQTLVSRELSPANQAVVTIGQISAGTTHNIIPAEANLKLTVRSYDDATRQHLLSGIERLASHIATAHRAPSPPAIAIRKEYTPALYNDPKWTEQLRQTLSNVLGADHIHDHAATMMGEDFSRYSRELKIPGVMILVGAQNAKKLQRSSSDAPLPGLHSAFWLPDADATITAAEKLLTAAILTGLEKPAK